MQKEMIIKILLITLLLGTINLFPQPLYGAQFVSPPNSIRVALGVDLASAEFAISEGNYELADYVTQRAVSAKSSGTWVVAPAGSSHIQLSHNGSTVQGLGSSMLVLRQKDPTGLNIFRFHSKHYRGDMLIQNINGRIQIINVIDVEKYLYGVVGAEIGTSAPHEALKAQAIVSRTYALYYKEHPQLNYDIGITTQWQVYEGYDMELLSGAQIIKAVDDTKGQVIYYDGKLIQAFFHSNSGGYTEGSENVWSSAIPYIQPVSTPEDSHALAVPQQAGWPAVTYQWEKSFTKNELMEQLRIWNREHPSEPVSVGEVQDLVISRNAVNPVTHEFLPNQTLSKRVTELSFVGRSGTKSFFKDRIRSVLGLRSTLFDIIMDSSVKVWTAFGTQDYFNQGSNILAVNVDGMVSKLNGNNGNYYVVGADGVKAVPKSFSNVTFKGKGYGHGLGMSQWGARGMAAQGADNKKIIHHYYNQNKYDGRLQIKPYQTNQY